MNPLFADEPLILDDPYMSRMSEEKFFTFCQQHRKWRIERNAQQEILVVAPTFSLTGKRNARLITQLGMWWDQYPEAGEIFDSNAGFTLPNGAVHSPDASWGTRRPVERPEPRAAGRIRARVPAVRGGVAVEN